MGIQWRSFWVLVLVTLAAFGVRAGSLTAQSLWRDEVDALCYAYEFPHLLLQVLAPERADALVTPCACPPPPVSADWAEGNTRQQVLGLAGAMIRQNGPLYYFLLRGWVALAGYTEYAMRYFSLLFGVLCVPLTAALGTRMLGRGPGIVAAALMALAPYMVWYGQEVKMYTLVPFLVLLGLYGLWRGMGRFNGPLKGTIKRENSSPEGKRQGPLSMLLQPTGRGTLHPVAFGGGSPATSPPRRLRRRAPSPRGRGGFSPLSLGEGEGLGERVRSKSPFPSPRGRGEGGQGDGVRSPRLLSDRGGAWWVVQVIATTVLLYTHIWGALLIAIQGLWLLLTWPRWRPHRWGALIGMALLTLPYLPLALWQFPAALARRETGFPYHPLWDMAAVLLNGWSTGITGWGWPWSVLALGGMAALGLVAGWAHRPTRGAALSLALWPTVPLLVIWLISLRQPLFTDRYLIWGAPAFYLLAGKGMTAGWERRGVVRYLTLAVVLFVLVVFAANLHLQAATPIKSDFRAAAAYVEARYRPGDLIIFQIPHVRYTFDYYFGPTDYRWVDGLYTNHRTADGQYRLSEETVGRWMAVVVGDRTTVWLVASEVPMWDERNLVQGWLETAFRREDEGHFARVEVYRYGR